jgi:hypothetical protein
MAISASYKLMDLLFACGNSHGGNIVIPACEAYTFFKNPGKCHDQIFLLFNYSV